MDNKSFNLLDEAWIRVIYPDCREDEVSLKQIFAGAHTYTDLAGELPTQNAAVLRLLLAVLHAVFYRFDEEGNPSEITNSDDAYDRWQALWEMGRFPTKPIERYLESYRYRFDLFDDKRPFYQVPQAKIGTAYSSAKLNGEISESGNKKRLFPTITGEEKNTLSYAEAARWLLYLYAFDDSSLKPKGDNLPSIGVGWLGQIGYIQLVGKNLFETLMLNLVLLNENDEPWGNPCPVWELEVPRSSERTRIAHPDNQAALLTLQSRRLLLKTENGLVTGYYLIGGDFIETKNAFCEQMTVWKPILKGKQELVGFQPARHNHERKMWQDFSGIAAANEKHHMPGIVSWVNRLLEYDCLPPETMGVYRIVSVDYDGKHCSIINVFEDTLTFHLNLLSELNGKWIERIANEVIGCERLAWAVGALAKELDLAAAGDSKLKEFDLAAKGKCKSSVELAKEQLYYRIDVPFRSWLLTLDADQSDIEREEKSAEWRDTAVQIADRLGQELVKQAGPAAFSGKSVESNKQKDAKDYYCAPDSYNSFRLKLISYRKIKSFRDEKRNGGQ